VVVVVLECGRKLVINHFVQESWVGAPTLLTVPQTTQS
jgi:hypothetical protein